MFGIGFELSFYRFYRSEFVVQNPIVMTKLISAAQKSIEKFKFDRKRSKIYRKWSNLIKNFDLYQLYQFDNFDLLISFFNLSIINMSILIKFNQKEIKNRSNLWSTIRFWHWNQNCHYITVQIWMAWNPNWWWFDSRTQLPIFTVNSVWRLDILNVN